MKCTWTEERTALLEEEWAAGSTARQIADKLGDTTRNAVIGKARRSGLAQRVPTPNRRTIGRPANKPKTKHNLKEEVALRGAEVALRGAVVKIKEVALQEPTVEIVDSEIPAWQQRHLLELKRHQCRYPVGEVGKPGFFFCGAPKKKGSPYCLPHHRRCHTKEREGRWFSFAKLF